MSSNSYTTQELMNMYYNNNYQEYTSYDYDTYYVCYICFNDKLPKINKNKYKRVVFIKHTGCKYCSPKN